jgi:hypothetical protein
VTAHAGNDGPFFVVGVARSGTTLLRQMLRGHPRLAIPRESHFVPDALQSSTPEAALERVLSDRHFHTWDVDPDDVRRRVAGLATPTPAAVVRAAFEAYADAQDKPRWGEKTPAYVFHVALLADAFPDARFVHLVRDGREVIQSLLERRWGPDDLLLAARFWRRGVRAAQRDGARVGSRYVEVRYDELVAEPAAVLEQICAFLGEERAAEMLDYSPRAAEEHEELPGLHRHLLEPPTPGLRDWRARWSDDVTAKVEAVIGPTLVRLGYPLALPAPSLPVRGRAEVELLGRRLRARLRRG